MKDIDTVVKEEQVKIIEVKDDLVKEGKTEVSQELSNKLESIEQIADEVYEKVKKGKNNQIEILSSINTS